MPSIIRPEIQAATPTRGGYVLVYQSATTQGDLVEILQQLPDQEFRVYGFNKDEAHGNVLLRPFSEAGFIAELAGCRAVLTNGGFSLISEAVYLRKPVGAVPIPAQFEQWLNAAEVEKRGYGRHFGAITAANVAAFLAGLPQFEAALASYSQRGNEVLFKHLAELLTELYANFPGRARAQRASPCAPRGAACSLALAHELESSRYPQAALHLSLLIIFIPHELHRSHSCPPDF
ncbi:MAG: glycosyltransferase family protein [Hymenobacter sp.]